MFLNEKTKFLVKEFSNKKQHHCCNSYTHLLALTTLHFQNMFFNCVTVHKMRIQNTI